MSGFVNSSYHTSFRDAFFSDSPDHMSLDVTVCAFIRKVTYSAESRFFSSVRRGLGPAWHSINFWNASFRSCCSKSFPKLNASSQQISHFGQGSNLRRMESKTSCMYLVYFVSAFDQSTEYVLLIAVFAPTSCHTTTISRHK